MKLREIKIWIFEYKNLSLQDYRPPPHPTLTNVWGMEAAGIQVYTLLIYI